MNSYRWMEHFRMPGHGVAGEIYPIAYELVLKVRRRSASGKVKERRYFLRMTEV